jgi:hypothetical protein
MECLEFGLTMWQQRRVGKRKDDHNSTYASWFFPSSQFSLLHSVNEIEFIYMPVA